MAIQTVDYAAEVIRSVSNALNWRLIRGFGQLQILTRASYAMLIIVPVLAATWPAVRLVVNQHNKAVREAADLLRTSRGDLERVVDEARKEAERLASVGTSASGVASGNAEDFIGGVKTAASRIGVAAERYTTDYAEHTIPTPRLPWSLAAAFFGALFVVLGHLIYQMAAPEPIRQATWDEFVVNRKDDYARHPSDAALDRAREFLQTRAGGRVAASERFEDEHILEQLYGLNREEREKRLQELSAPRLRSLISWIDSEESPAPPDYVREIRGLAQDLLPSTASSSHSDMTLIERGARAEYLYLATQRPFAVVVTGVLYALALWIILLIIKVQAIAVITTAEWNSPRDLFLH
jgi:hypothetical protein